MKLFILDQAYKHETFPLLKPLLQDSVNFIFCSQTISHSTEMFTFPCLPNYATRNSILLF